MLENSLKTHLKMLSSIFYENFFHKNPNLSIFKKKINIKIFFLYLLAFLCGHWLNADDGNDALDANSFAMDGFWLRRSGQVNLSKRKNTRE
jgi:hypothetical protein